MKKTRWAGRILIALSVLFLLFDAAGHLIVPAAVVEAFNRLGYPLSLSPALAIIELVCLIAYVIPRTAILGAILLTGYLGGAVAAHVRVRDHCLTRCSRSFSECWCGPGFTCATTASAPSSP